MINDYLEPEDYVEPRCVLCGDAYGAMPEVKSVPQQRIVAKMDEYMAHRDYAGAERHLLYWLEEAELGHDLRGQLLLRNELAGHYRKVQDKENATLNAEKALELLKALDFEGTISAGTTYVNAATVMNAFGEDERSLELFGKARTVYENAPRTDKALLGGLYNNMALTYTSLGRYGEASELYEKALSVMRSVPGGKLEQAITPKTKAIVTVDLGGVVCDYDKVFEIAEKKKGLFSPLESDGTPLGDLSSRIQKAIGRVAVVSDSAHALGASRIVSVTGRGRLEQPTKKYTGAIADFSSFSFHAVKNFTTAEGGASTWLPLEGIDDSEIYEMFQLLSLHGQSKDALSKEQNSSWEYDIVGAWYKYNMTDIMAAIGLKQSLTWFIIRTK